MSPSLLLAFVCAAVFSSAATEDTSEPVRPGAYGLKDGSGQLQVVEPFWNANAIMFLYAPAFDFRRLPEASHYRFAVSGASGYAREFLARDPWASLKEIWNEVPVGLTTVVCAGVGRDGKPCGEAGRRTFWRKAPFDSTSGHYPPARRGYAETAKLILSNQFATAEIRRMTKGEAPTWYRFPTKQLASIIGAACRRAKLCPETREASLAVARAAADYLLSLSPSAGSPLAHFTPTYKPDETHSDWAGTTMLIYPADGANAFLSAYEATGERKYLEAARGACDTFIRLQGADGSWPLKVSLKDAKPLTSNRCLTTRHIELFERMYRATGDVRYREAGDRAFGFIERGPLATWNWEGQFEDTPPTKPYMNLTKHDACSTAIYILQRYPGDAKRLAQARDLLRFAEDQFVNWEKPFADGKVLQPEKGKGYYNHYWDQDKWLMPSVFEQYGCYTPVDASAAKLIRTYLALYRAEGRPLDFAKARVLGDMITRMTDDDGLESTWWNTKELRQSIWYNCMFACEAALEELMAVRKPAESTKSEAASRDGDALCSPAYFWMWNGRLETKALCRQLDEMHAQGLRNVCVHPFPKAFRPGRFCSDMSPDYLTPEYLAIFAEVTRYAAKLGMHCYLYDEGGWPSGGACGRVAQEDKDGKLAQRWLALDKDGKVQITVDRYDFKGFAPYPSIVEKGTTERFLRLTHDRYAEVLGDELGKSVRVAFTDEPNAPSGFGWTSDFAAEFKRRKGYDLEPHLAEMLKRQDVSDEKVAAWSIDYRDVMADLVVERYLAPVRDWCRAHNVLSGGHMNGEDNPSWTSGYGHGSILRALRAMDVPGVDIIWRQAFPEDGGQPAVAPPFPRYAASAMHQNGGRFALSETFGIFGDSVTPEQMKWLVDYQLVRGINTFVFGYYAQTYRGQWMTLFEPHGGLVAPYWTMERPFFEYIERLCRELACGRSATDVAVLYDVRGLWAGGRWTQEADAAQRAVAAALDCRQVDYDFVEDRDLASATLTSDGVFRVGAAHYRTVVLPTGRWLDAKAAVRLKDFEKAGGRVIRGTDVSSVPPMLSAAGDGASNLRVMRRVDGRRTLYFTHNEALSAHRVSISFPHGGTVARFDPAQDRWETVTEDGRLEMTYGPGETALYAVGAGDLARPVQSPVGAGDLARPLTGPWTLRPLVSHEVGRDDFVIRSCTNAPVPTVLGDWRATLGERFSGRAVYCTTFVAETAGVAQLDLGEVKYAASVRLNGRDLGPRFFGPYRWDVELAAGTNILEVTVANLLVNQLGHEDVRDRIARDFPPASAYDRHQRPYDRANHESGLYGPVSVSAAKGCTVLRMSQVLKSPQAPKLN